MVYKELREDVKMERVGQAQIALECMAQRDPPQWGLGSLVLLGMAQMGYRHSRMLLSQL